METRDDDRYFAMAERALNDVQDSLTEAKDIVFNSLHSFAIFSIALPVMFWHRSSLMHESPGLFFARSFTPY